MLEISLGKRPKTYSDNHFIRNLWNLYVGSKDFVRVTDLYERMQMNDAIQVAKVVWHVLGRHSKTPFGLIRGKQYKNNKHSTRNNHNLDARAHWELNQERWVNFKIFGDDLQAEEMSITTFGTHDILTIYNLVRNLLSSSIAFTHADYSINGHIITT